jgi:replicative DNA helicase Mcm
MEPNKSKTYSDFIGPRQSIAGSLTESACVDVILGYLRKFHLGEIDALIPESVFQLPFPHEGKTFWNNECTVEYTDDVIFDIYFTNPTIFFDYVRKGISALKKEKGNASSVWMYLQIKLIEDSPYDLSEIKPHMVNTPVCFDAVVLGLEPRTMYIKTAWYECPKGHPGIDIQCDKHRQLHPQVCTHSIGIDMCGEKMFLNVDKSTQDYSQNIVIQEPIENTKFGNPIEYDAKITGEMVGDVRVSQKMRLSAVLRTVVDRKKNENEIYYDILSYKDLADSKEVLPTEEEIAIMKKDVEEPDFMLKLIKSFAPEVYGLDSVKESLILGLAGGVRSRNKRGSVNILLLGDPSTAKSTLLKECAEVITKSLYTSGKSASAAGLTAAAVKRPNGAWMIMPGVVVLCNDGFVFIDEIDKATPEDRSSLHEAMEQQTVSIAKAGMHMTFPARTAVFAAGNPQTGKWELSLSAAENVNLPPTLLSRFDVKWRILDQKDFSRDTNMAEHILSQFTDPAEETFNRNYLRKYFAYINKLKPKLTKEAQKELLDTYRKLRDKSKDQESVVIDTRQLEGLIRLSTAHAKCYFRDIIDKADVMHAVKVYYESLKSFGFDPEEGTVDQSTFFTSAKLNKETTFWNAFTALDDEAKGGVDPEELMVKLSQSPHYEEESARQEVEKKHSKENKIYMSKTGRYMRV